MNSEDQEAALLEIACARWDVCHAQKLLAECLNWENQSLCKLHQFKVNKFAELADDANFSIGRIRAAFNSHVFLPPSSKNPLVPSNQCQAEDGEVL